MLGCAGSETGVGALPEIGLALVALSQAGEALGQHCIREAGVVVGALGPPRIAALKVFDLRVHAVRGAWSFRTFPVPPHRIEQLT